MRIYDLIGNLMGSTCSTPEQREILKKHKEIEKDIEKDKDNEIGNQKLLLLGTGECGKSTILKQMQILHNNGYTDAELRDKAGMVYSNILLGMSQLLRSIDLFMYTLANDDLEKDCRKVLSVVDGAKDFQPFTTDLYNSLKALWKDKAVQRAFERRAEFQLPDSLKHFMDNLDRIHSANYKPSLDDVLQIRIPTTGVVQVQFPIKGCIFRIVDVGGQRSERRKWIHHFDDVSAIIFICAINEYDQKLQEDETTSRMYESMSLFREICNLKWFIKASMILFLNKRDLFMEKIKTVSLKVCFKKYTGDNSYRNAVDFISEAFENMNAHKKTRKIYIHETCATDTDQVQRVIDSVIDIVIGKNLRGTGME